MFSRRRRNDTSLASSSDSSATMSSPRDSGYDSLTDSGDGSEDFSLVRAYLRHSQNLASRERESKESQDDRRRRRGSSSSSTSSASADDDDGIQLMAPGYAPSSLFSSSTIRNSMRLEGMHPGTSVSQSSSSSSQRPLRVSQLISHHNHSDGDLRASAINDQVQSFQNILAQGQRRRLTESQSNIIGVYLGNFGEMISKLELLIDQHIDDPERLGTFVMLHESITDAVKAYEATIVAQFADEEAFRGFSFDPSLYNYEDNRTEGDDHHHHEKEEESEEEADDWDDADDEDTEGKEEKECPICMDNFWWPGKRGYQLKCGCLYCKPCLRGNYETLINDGKVLKLVCPNPTCAASVEEDDLKVILTNKQFARYQQFYLLASLRNDPTVRWCPKLGCETACHGSEENCHMTCPTCSTQFCWKCNLEWHEGITCERAKKQADKGKKKKTRQERRAERYIKKHARPCPQCKTPIQKNDGCNHMTCQSCRCTEACYHEFCWICMGRFTGYDHFQTGKCKGLQNWSSNWTKYGAYAGIGVGVAAGAVVAAPIVIGLAIPTLAIGLPIYGAYKIVS